MIRLPFCAFALVIAFLGATSVPALADDETGLLTYLPPDKVIKGSIMELAAPLALAEVTQKFQLAVREDADWFRAYMAEHKGVAVLPYHPRLGLTRAEYNTFVELTGKFSLSASGKLTVAMVPLAENGYELMADDTASPLHGLQLLLADDLVRTPFGDLTERSTIQQDDADSATGRWSGVQWKTAHQDGNDLTVVKLALGKRDDFGDGILFYDVNVRHDGKSERFYMLLLYPLEAPE